MAGINPTTGRQLDSDCNETMFVNLSSINRIFERTFLRYEVHFPTHHRRSSGRVIRFRKKTSHSFRFRDGNSREIVTRSSRWWNAIQHFRVDFYPYDRVIPLRAVFQGFPSRRIARTRLRKRTRVRGSSVGNGGTCPEGDASATCDVCPRPDHSLLYVLR